MQRYIQGAAAAGKLTTATELSNVVGMALCMAAEADYAWLRECARDAYQQAGSDGSLYAALVAEARENINIVAAQEPIEKARIIDLAEETARKHGLN